LAAKFAKQGWRVFAGQRTLSSSQEVATARPAETSATGAITPIALDVSDGASVASAARTLALCVQGLDVLINNAAVNPVPESSAVIGELDFDAIRLAYDANAVGPLRVIQSFLPLLERGERKLIVNVSSEAGSLAHSWRDRSYGYCMSKAALNMQTTILDRALRPRGFNVIAVHPGWLRTDMGGPNAHLDPADSADGMYALIDGADANTARFLQHDGKAFPW